MASTRMLSGVAAKCYELLEELGRGTYGVVWKAQHRNTGVHFAIKFMERNAWKYRGNAERELTILLKVKHHKNLAKWFDMVLAGEQFDEYEGEGHRYQMLVMEFCDMDLTVYLEKRQNRQLENCFDVAQQIMAGVVFLHTHDPQIIHRDIKPENILVKLCAHSNEAVIKIADFGISNAVEFSDVLEDITDPQQLAETMRNMKTTVGGRGTFPYMAPEFFAAKDGRGLTGGKFRIDASVDIFALGLVFAFVFGYNSGDFYVVVIKEGIAGEGLGLDMYEAHRDGEEMPQLDLGLSEGLEKVEELIRSMTSFKPQSRPSAQDVSSELFDIVSPRKTNEDTPQAVEPAPPEISQPLRLLQALNDNDQATFDECIARDDVKQWIDTEVKLNTLDNLREAIAPEIMTCLGFASRYRSPNTVRQLVAAGAAVSVVDSEGCRPLHRACQSKVNALEKVQFLLQRKSSVANVLRKLQFWKKHKHPLVQVTDYFNNTPLHCAVIAGNDDVISALIQHGAVVNEPGQFGRTPLHKACELGLMSCIRALMTQGADIDARDARLQVPPVYLAAAGNHRECVTLLLETYGASVNVADADGNTALHIAALNGHVDILRTLASCKQCEVNKRNKRGATALHRAAEQGHVTCVRELATLGATVDARDNSRSMTSLHYATINGHVVCVRELVLQGAAVDARDGSDETPLHWAARNGHSDCVTTLLDADAALINVTEKHFLRTALHLAAEHGHVAVVEALLKHTMCDTSITDRYGGSTALHIAAGRGHVAVVQALLQHPTCDTSIKDRASKTAADVVRTWRHADIAELIDAKHSNK